MTTPEPEPTALELAEWATSKGTGAITATITEIRLIRTIRLAQRLAGELAESREHEYPGYKREKLLRCAAEVRVERLAGRVAELERIAKHAKHDLTCDPYAGCTCGLDAARSALTHRDGRKGEEE